ncbi:hypothetical protein HG536_0D00530 [Torulaspora globosa]|uniref:Vacuolar import/degradation Vid27 C-terminal domain-containing protein n=1 Tax=Torulaspora globosa TaxID=48254 RepID=A0A7G3ZG95_9SACH|nr:uncharacterized protein HG536_0D00530 [Torulaspora globosa]QLL32531.1 hypothetical protein HG536_0D00530 [Torulaspora globosa]
MNILRKFMESGVKQEVMMIPSGQFDLLRSKKSPKASLECIYNDATLALRETGHFSYALVVQKNADELEASNGEGGDEFSDDSMSALSVQSKKKEDEWVFELSEELGFHKKWNKQGDMAFVWNNTLGDEEDERVQFVLAPDVPHRDVDQFLQVAQRCEYETKYKESASNATRADLDKIAAKSVLLSNNSDYQEEPEIKDEKDPHDGFPISDKLKRLELAESSSDDNSEFEDAKETPQDVKAQGSFDPNRFIEVKSAPKGKHLCTLACEIFVFDPIQGIFVWQQDAVGLTIVETGDYEYWLALEGKSLKMGTDLSPNINPTFDLQKNSFIFNYTFNGITLSYMLKFANSEDVLSFKSILSKCLWLTLNKKPWEDLPDNEKVYVTNTAATVDEELDEILKEDSNESSSENELSESDEEDNLEHSSRILSSESFGESAGLGRPKSEGNRSLTVAFKNDRSYVVRGNKIGVFKVDSEGLDFVAAIQDVSDLAGNRIDPTNPMLYMEDKALVLRDGKDSEKIYKMDLERGKIVEEWETGGKNMIQVGPAKKFDQMTPEQTLLGVSKKGLFKLDPRLNKKDKVVQEQSKEYASNYKFSTLGTTENGYIAVGSENGDVRLYDRLGIRAKTAIPSLGQPIRHITTSSDGRWLLCTCDTSLLLMNLTVQTGKNAGSIGFLKPFPASENAKTYILNISPEHASYIVTSTRKPIKFTKAYFNTGVGKEEQTIVTSTGQFAVSWSLKKIIKGDNKSYVMKRYEADVIEDNFEFGTDRKVIVALKDDVSVSKIKSFKTPDKQVMAPNLSLFYSSDDDDDNRQR